MRSATLGKGSSASVLSHHHPDMESAPSGLLSRRGWPSVFSGHGEGKELSLFIQSNSEVPVTAWLRQASHDGLEGEAFDRTPG